MQINQHAGHVKDKDYSRLTVHAVCSPSQRPGQIQRADGLRTFNNRLQTDLFTSNVTAENVDRFPGSFSFARFVPNRPVLYKQASVTVWPEITSNTH